MASFFAFVAAFVVAMVVNDTLAPYGVPPLKVLASTLAFFVSFWFLRRLLAGLRPDP